MNKTYNVREVEVTVEPGVILRAEVPTIEAAKAFLHDVSKAGLGRALAASKGEIRPEDARGVETHQPSTALGRMEVRAGLQAGQLKKLIAIKDDTPQLLQPRVFKNTTDGVLALIYAAEAGLQKNNIEYEQFSGIFEHQNIKSGSPLSMLISNLRQVGYIDKKIYADGRRIRLTAKGENRAIEVLGTAVGSLPN